MTGIRNDSLYRTGHFGGHVIRCRQKRGVKGTNNHQRRNSYMGQRLDDPGITLNEYPPGRPGQTGSPAVCYPSYLRSVGKGIETPSFITHCGGLGRTVPALPGFVPFETRAGIEEHQSGYSLRMGQVKGEGKVPAKRQSPHHGLFPTPVASSMASISATLSSVEYKD